MVQLKWEKPEKDGGRPILHYVVEMKDKFSDWTEVGVASPVAGDSRETVKGRSSNGSSIVFSMFA